MEPAAGVSLYSLVWGLVTVALLVVLAMELGAAGPFAALGALAAEDGETSVAIAGGLWWFWYRRGFYTLGREMLAAALALPSADLSARANALNGLASFYLEEEDFAANLACHEQGLALRRQLNDPVGKKLMQLVMTDEAFHHKFGKIWADRTIPKLSPEEHAVIEDWAAHCFQTLLFNLVAPTQQRDLYEEFGLDPDRVIAEMAANMNDETRRESMKEQSNIFRVLVKTLLNGQVSETAGSVVWDGTCLLYTSPSPRD